MEDDGLSGGAQPWCPGCGVALRTATTVFWCPSCGYEEEFELVRHPGADDLPSIHGG